MTAGTLHKLQLFNTPEKVTLLHNCLLKTAAEFDWRLEYIEKRLYVKRLDPKAVRGSKDQNLFFRRLKPMVRTSLNGQPWSIFLLDTGSEPSMVTR